ncbi:hypothetical protein N5D61_03445 [Pseudomonas sp. GD03842]|uniref:hypothetical protein n=1 Tax=unclassified Pseudomonas TaxID=196821 RepID=UPI000D3D0D5E|nr:MULTISPECIES: hypothetical protein [unclassified Pseudomonas]MDH0745400.1 hypothetical protein [Pseudomonas sp. GD03842]RAU41547.1 hypothetical protein DBP26_022630 [Pseudomonas sp. RIT 409]RAU44790.1 hypothetical protein DBY65_026655 [Pseudomonas sp. RIT 412]
MEDEKDIPSSAQPQQNKSQHSTESTERDAVDREPTAPNEQVWSVPHYEEFHAGPRSLSTQDQIPAEYSRGLNSILDMAWRLDEAIKTANPTLAAPSIEGHPSSVLTQEQLMAGVYVNIPRSSRIWSGDHLKMRWGSNTLFTVVPVADDRHGPRMRQFVCLDRLAKYETGEIDVRYEVVRRARLVGISETLTIKVYGSKTRPRSAHPMRAIRRRRLRP